MHRVSIDKMCIICIPVDLAASFPSILISKLCWCGLYEIFHVPFFAGYIRDFDLDLRFFWPLTIKKFLASRWLELHAYMHLGPKWIDGSKIKRPRNLLYNWTFMCFDLPNSCLLWWSLIFCILAIKFNFGGCLSVNTCTRPQLEAKYRGYIVMTVLHNVTSYEVCTFFLKNWNLSLGECCTD